MTTSPTPDGFLVPPVDGTTVLEENAELFVGMDHIVGAYFPNSFRIMARDPELLAACIRLGGVVMRRPGRIGIPMKWLIGHMVSAAAGCRYCTAHTIEHGAQVGLTPEQVDDMWSYETSPHFSDAERSVMRFAFSAGQVPNATTPEQADELRQHFDDDEIVEIISVIAYWGFWNRWNDTFATPLEAEPAVFAAEHLTGIGWTPPAR